MLPLLVLWLPKCRTVAQIQGQDKLSVVRPFQEGCWQPAPVWTRVPITDRTRLLSDNGPGYVSRAFRDYLGMVGIRHYTGEPLPPSDQRQA